MPRRLQKQRYPFPSDSMVLQDAQLREIGRGQTLAQSTSVRVSTATPTSASARSTPPDRSSTSRHIWWSLRPCRQFASCSCKDFKPSITNTGRGFDADVPLSIKSNQLPGRKRTARARGAETLPRKAARTLSEQADANRRCAKRAQADRSAVSSQLPIPASFQDFADSTYKSFLDAMRSVCRVYIAGRKSAYCLVVH